MRALSPQGSAPDGVGARRAGLRGTGCSSGEFELFSWRSALDGREIIDDWIARQPWSNGAVVILGHSYSEWYRPWRPHQERSPVEPGAVVDYLIDVFLVGHVFLPVHELVVKVHAPPADDNDYAYVQKTLPGANTLHFGPDAPSRLMLPVIPMSEVRGLQTPPTSCAYASMRCVGGPAG